MDFLIVKYLFPTISLIISIVNLFKIRKFKKRQHEF
jgi:hypothetical protein